MSNTDTLAVNGGTPVRDNQQKSWTRWPPNEEDEWEKTIEPALREVFLSRTEGLPAPNGLGFGEAFAEYCNAKYGIMMPHGTEAIMAALAGALDLDGIGEGGEVIIPNFTFIATASAPLSMRCTVALVDADPRTFTISPEAVENAITDKTVAILPVHVCGHPADMGALKEIADRHSLKIVEDCAQAHGAEYHGQRVGSLSDAGAYSFQSSKNLTSGEGGCLVTNDEDVRDRAHAFKDVGRRPGGARWEYPRLGWNYRTSEYLAALLLTRLPYLDEQTNRRNENAAILNEGLNQAGGLIPPHWADYTTRHGYHLYMMLYQPEAFGGRTRAEFVKAISAEGIPCGPCYTSPLSDTGGLKSIAERYPEQVRRLPCPNIEYICDHNLIFSQQTLLGSKEDMQDIVTAVQKIRDAWG
jgi:dTDP-4-amino-4,6-dideoxygalactose transaminase